MYSKQCIEEYVNAGFAVDAAAGDIYEEGDFLTYDAVYDSLNGAFRVPVHGSLRDVVEDFTEEWYTHIISVLDEQVDDWNNQYADWG